MTTALAELARQVRGETLEFLELPRSWLLWSPPGTANHILWHTGHALWLQDALTVAPLTGRSELPPRWEETFGQNSDPSSTPEWPDPAEIGRHLDAQLQRILQLLAEYAGHIAVSQT
jgi:hypothetical protein